LGKSPSPIERQCKAGSIPPLDPAFLLFLFRVYRGLHPPDDFRRRKNPDDAHNGIENKFRKLIFGQKLDGNINAYRAVNHQKEQQAEQAD
jgi:hypothetical protein